MKALKPFVVVHFGECRIVNRTDVTSMEHRYEDFTVERRERNALGDSSWICMATVDSGTKEVWLFNLLRYLSVKTRVAGPLTVADVLQSSDAPQGSDESS